jgi:DNA-binding NarL/FixJ family response regulator
VPARVVSAVVAAGPSARAAIRSSLASAGIPAVDFYGDVESAIAAVRRASPQLCVLDRDLPGAGLSAIAALTAPRQPLRLVVVGGGGSRTEARAARLAGAAVCLPGAVDAERLTEALVAIELMGSTAGSPAGRSGRRP